MLVEVRPLPLKKWHGKSGKEDFTRPKTIEALYNSESQKYSTGLTEEEQKKYEKLTGFDLSDRYNPEIPHPFWSTAAAMVKLPNSTTIFDTAKPLDFIKVKLLKASKFVANSMKEWEEGLWPDAHHVIFDEEEETNIKASKVELKNKAVSLSLKLSKDEKINIIQILSDKSARGRSDDFVNVEVDKIVTERPVEFIKYAEMDTATVYVRAAVLEAIHRNILVKEGSAVLYMGDQIGYDF